MPGGRRFRIIVQILVVLLVVGGLAALALYVDSGPGPIVYHAAGMEQVGVRKNIIYFQDGKDAPAMDLYLPAGPAPAQGWPVVGLIHGGPISAGRGVKDWPGVVASGGARWATGLGARAVRLCVFSHVDVCAAATTGDSA